MCWTLKTLSPILLYFFLKNIDMALYPSMFIGNSYGFLFYLTFFPLILVMAPKFPWKPNSSLILTSLWLLQRWPQNWVPVANI